MAQAPASTASRNSWLLLAVLAGLVFLSLWLRPTESLFRDDPTAHHVVGKPIPTAVLQPLTSDASEADLQQLKGSVLLINFWGTWCPPCREELPGLVQVAGKYAKRSDFRFLPVSCSGDFPEDLTELKETTTAYLQANNLAAPSYADPDGALREALAEMGAMNGYPTTVLVDRQGTIRAVWEGYSPGLEHKIEQTLASLLVE